ncbi:MAG: hypothetical protein ACREOW_06375 [Thermodesulfobacteriota bacterium]
MQNYLVRYFSNTAIELGQTLSFDMPDDVKIVVRDFIPQDPQGVPFSYNFLIDATCYSETAEKAIEETRGKVEGVVSIIPLSLSTFVEPCIVNLVLDVSPETVDREILQYLPFPYRVGPSRKFNRDVFSILWKYLEESNSENRSRIHRAIRWYRKALLEYDPLDQFLNLWIGLEVINELVKRKYELPYEKPTRSCPSCGNAVVLQPTLAGVEYVVVELSKYPQITWRSILDVRQQLAHGFGKIADLDRKVDDLIPVLRKSLLIGILDLLNVPENLRSRIIREPLGYIPKPYLKVQSVLYNLPIEDIISGKSNPRFELVNSNVTTNCTKKGLKLQLTDLKVKLRGCQVECLPPSFEVAYPMDPEDPSADIKLSVK